MNEVKATLRRVEEKLDMLIGMHTGLQGPAGGGAPAAPVDEYYDNVVSLLHFDGDLTDQKGKTWTANGVAADGVAKFGTNSLGVDGTGFISAPDSADWYFGTEDFTVEMWIRFTAAGPGNSGVIIEQAANATQYAPFLIYQPAGTYNILWHYSLNLGAWTTLSNSIGTATQNQWHHLAFVRNGASLRGYLGGVGGTDYNIGTNEMPNSGSTMLLGGGNFASTDCSCQIDDFRITKGVARYTTNFTPPTLAFPDA